MVLQKCKLNVILDVVCIILGPVGPFKKINYVPIITIIFKLSKSLGT